MFSKTPPLALQLHTAFWFLIAVIIVTAWWVAPGQYSLGVQLVRYVIIGGANVFLFYLNYLFLLPEVQRKAGTRIYLLYLTLAIIAAIFLKFILLGFNNLYFQGNPLRSLAYTSYVTAFFAFTSTVLYFFAAHIGKKQLAVRQFEQKRQMEVQFLKSQINPHFLFNALNNIYALSIRNSQATPDAILKLSELMRYTIYESRGTTAPLARELTFIEQYITLQKLRFGNNAFVHLEVEGEAGNLHIVPLILITFVENAFKHGVLNNPEHPVIIFAHIVGYTLTFNVTNRVAAQNKDVVGGVGVTNVISRLELMYPGRYSLNLKEAEGYYSVELTLVLEEEQQ